MATPRPWIVLRHDPLTQHDDNLWSVEGDVPRMSMRRRMTIARTADGRLVVHNAVCVDEFTVKAITALGEPSVLVVPNAFHRLDAHAWRERFPKSRVLCPAGAVDKVREVVEVDGTYEDFGRDANVRFETLEGTAGREGVVLVSSGARSALVFNDCLFNVAHQPGFGGMMLRLVGSSGGPRITLVGKLFLAKDRAALRAHLLRLADTPGLARLVPGHGDLVERDAPAVLRDVAAGLA